MLAVDPQIEFEELRDKLVDQISKTFPIRDRKSRFEVRVSDVEAADDRGLDDIKGQHEARLTGKSWASPVTGKVEVLDLESNKVVASRRMELAKIPRMTRHYTYIIGGQEKSIAKQWRLRPGVYVKATEKPGEYEAQFQLAKGSAFDIQKEPTGYLHIKMGSRKIPLYSVMHAYGVSDDEMKKAWGESAFKATLAKSKPDKDLRSLFEVWNGAPLAESENPAQSVVASLRDTKVDPTVVKTNLGVASDHINKDVLLEASRKLIDVSAGTARPDPIDSLRYKELWQAKDHFAERLAGASDSIRRRVMQTMGKPSVAKKLLSGDSSILRDIISPDLIRRPFYSVFTTSLANPGKQTNPVTMLADRSMVTITGPGGITNPHSITHSNTAIDPSHLGVLDPVFTPESNPGVNTHLTFGVTIKDRKPHLRLFNLKTGKIEEVDAATASASNIVLPDQVAWKGGKPVPNGKSVRMSDAHGDVRDDLPWNSAQYVMPSAVQVFATETNLVPFMQNDAAGRTTMSARHMAQAISVVGREAPRVQVAAGGGETFEKIVGNNFLAHRAPVAGTVVAVKPDEISVRAADGKVHKVDLYHHYPTNDPKGMLHSTPLVAQGDKVREGQVLADNNFTKNGVLALGTNLRVAYLANGSNHEDGLVISQSAADKLRSVHLNKPMLLVSDDVTINKGRFLHSYDGVYSPTRLSKIGEDGIIKRGMRVSPGDPLVLALSKKARLSSVDENTGLRIGSALKNPFTNSSLVWDHDYEGEVVDVSRSGNMLTVHVKTVEPAQVGSKISTRHSAKGIVTAVMPDAQMPHDGNGRHVEMLINPTCYDEKTEFLTKRGWVFGRDLTDDDVFATMDPGSFCIEWERASRIVKEPYRGKMYRIKNQQVDLLVTPNHRMFTAPRAKGSDGTLGNLDFAKVNPKHFTDETAEEIAGAPRRYLKAGRWVGTDPGEFTIPRGSHTGTRGPAPRDGWGVPTMLWAEFMGWYLSEGYAYEKDNGGYAVGISQTHANPEKREQIRELLVSMGFEPTETENGYLVYHKGLYEMLKPLGGASDKYIPREILDLPPAALSLFLDAFIAGDGNTRWEPEHGRYGTRRLSSNSRKLIDGLQEICIKLGYAANIKEDSRTENYRTGHHYTMSIGTRCKAPWVNWDKTTKSNQVEEWVDYDGTVYCCTVPNTMVVVRRDGIPVISGNSVPGRMNPGQILETAAGKISEKTGKPYVVRNFEGGTDYLKKIQDDLKTHGLKETETLFDPKTGRKLGDVMVGPHYVFQLEHQIDKKTHVRSGGKNFTQHDAPMLHYDADTKIPRGGGHTGAQSPGSLGVFAALAAGLHNNLTEMQTLKADQDQAREVWGALINREKLPPPKVPFVYKKFEALLKGLGLDLQKDGTRIKMVPQTDAEIRKISAGALTKASKARWAEDDEPVRGGLFDRDLTGGPQGQKWSHIELVEPMPNPMYAKSIALALGVKVGDIPEIIEGKKKLPDGGYGGRGIRAALEKLDLDKELRAAKAALDNPKLRDTDLDKANFKVKALRALKEAGKTPAEAWTLTAVPVMPPIYRQQSVLPTGMVKNNPLNSLYRRLAMTNEALQKGEKIPYNATLDTRLGLYNNIAELFGTAPKDKKGFDLDVRGTREDSSKKLPGILHMISGDQPKDGFFQDKLVGKKQDYTARATIVVDPSLSVEDIGVPNKIAIEMFRPMVVQRLLALGYKPDEAQKMVSHKHPVALKALEKEVESRPVLLKRDPVLHQYGLLGQNIKLTEDPAIKVSPLVLPPLGGDIDGDTVALMVPLTQHAVEEAKRILPSQRTLSDSSGDVLYSPANEAALSLYRMSLARSDHGRSFKTKQEAEEAFKANRIDLNEAISISGLGKTTLGRARIAEIVPEKYRSDVLTNLEKPFDRKYQELVLRETAKGAPSNFVPLVDGMSRLGFQMAYESGHTVTLRDLEPLRKERGQLVDQTREEVSKLIAAGKGDQATQKWIEATRKLHDLYAQHYKNNPTNISDMAPAPIGSGIKAKREQFQGLVMAPMLVEDHLGAPSKVPVTRSFSEGVDVGGYFLQAAGARRGVIQKVDSVREPGYMSKLLVQANIDQPITAADCGTHNGILMPVTDKDIVDRRLAHDVNIGGHTYTANTVVTPTILAEAAKARVGQLVVRSPLKCRMPHGVCSHCMGLHPSGSEYKLGENAGIIAAQALGERAAQIMLKQTHGQGIVSTKGQGVEVFQDVQRLFNASDRTTLDAAIAQHAGKVERVEKTREGTWQIWMHGQKTPLISRHKPHENVVAGYEAKRGEQLTAGDPNINDLMATHGIDAVQQHLTKKIGDIYAGEGVLRRHVELAVRTSTGAARITDPGDHPYLLRGDYVQRPVLDEINRTALKDKKPIKYESVLSPIGSLPRLVQPDWMGRLQGEKITSTLTRAAQHGEAADVAGRHPVSRVAYGVHIANPMVH